MEISAASVQALRKATGAGMMDCKNALSQASGDTGKAIDILRTTGTVKVAKRQDRSTGEGLVHSYIHMGGRIGVLLELDCETDFVARTDEFIQLAKDICLHIAASDPEVVSRDQVSSEAVAKEKEIFSEQAVQSGKPEKVIEKIVTGRLEKFYQEICLLEQPFVKDPDNSIEQLVQNASAKLGEKIVLRRFARFQLGQ